MVTGSGALPEISLAVAAQVDNTSEKADFDWLRGMDLNHKR
jgi:hypothetical protein